MVIAFIDFQPPPPAATGAGGLPGLKS